jgi:hypothetical protein
MITKKIKGYRNILVVFLVSLFTLFVNPHISLNVRAESESYGFENTPATQQVTLGQSGGWLTSATQSSDAYVAISIPYEGSKSYEMDTFENQGKNTWFNFTYAEDMVLVNWSINVLFSIGANPHVVNYNFRDKDDNDIIKFQFSWSDNQEYNVYYYKASAESYQLLASDVKENYYRNWSFEILANDTVNYYFNKTNIQSEPAEVFDNPRIAYWMISHPDSFAGGLNFDRMRIATGNEFTGALTGNINISVFNESSPGTAIDDWSVDVLNSLGGVIYSLSNQSNPVEINHSYYGLGVRYFVISRENYSSRTYYTVVEDGWYYTLDALLPYENKALLYYIKVINTFSQVVSNASITINKNIGGTLYNITSGHTDSNGYFACWLIPNATLYVDITKTGYNSILGDEWIPEYGCSGIACPKTYVLNYTGGDTNITAYEFIHLEGSINSTGHISIHYRDGRSDTEDTNITIFENWNGTLTKNVSEGRINENIFTWVTSGYNTSRSHVAWLYVNHSEIWESPYFMSITIYPLDYNVTDYWSIEDRFIDVFGDFDLGYVRLLILFIPCLFLLVVFGSINCGLGILGAAFWLGFCSVMISDIPNIANIVILAGILATMGILVMVAKRGRDVI